MRCLDYFGAILLVDIIILLCFRNIILKII